MFLGIEIGGTKLQIGVGEGDGSIVALERARVDAAGAAEGIRRQILQLVPALLARRGFQKPNIEAVGIGFGGPVDTQRGTVAKSHQIGGWEGFPLVDWCRKELGWPAVLHNDADTAGLAEAVFGAGRGYSPIFYITIGSGIGGGLIIDQQIYRGAGAGAGEIGHLILPRAWGELAEEMRDSGDNRIQFPARVEDICSGWAMAKRMQSTVAFYLHERQPIRASGDVRDEALGEAQQLLDQVGGKLEQLTAEVIAQSARLGNRLAERNLTTTWRVLGWAIAEMITLLCPQRIVIGGGVSQIGEELLFQDLRLVVSDHVFQPYARCFEIVPAALGESVVVHGALRLAREASRIHSEHGSKKLAPS